MFPSEGTLQYKAAVKIQMLLNYKGIKRNFKCHGSIYWWLWRSRGDHIFRKTHRLMIQCKNVGLLLTLPPPLGIKLCSKSDPRKKLFYKI